MNQPVLPKVPTIGLYVPTRGRQQLCISTLNAWSQLAADPGNVKFLMGVDEDDEGSLRVIPGGGLDVHVFDKSVISTGQRNKALAATMKAKHDPDFYLLINDYYFPMTQYWDMHLRNAMNGMEMAAFLFAPQPTALHCTAATRRWMNFAGEYEPLIFPFWFSDQWRVELYCYVFNKPPIIHQNMMVGARQEGTQNMRELDWWWGLFVAMRPKRLRQAYEVYKAFGLTAPTFEEFVAARRNWIDDFALVDASKRPQFAAYEAAIGDRKDPGEKYLKCKASAEQIVRDENLTLWHSGI